MNKNAPCCSKFISPKVLTYYSFVTFVHISFYYTVRVRGTDVDPQGSTTTFESHKEKINMFACICRCGNRSQRNYFFVLTADKQPRTKVKVHPNKYSYPNRRMLNSSAWLS